MTFTLFTTLQYFHTPSLIETQIFLSSDNAYFQFPNYSYFLRKPSVCPLVHQLVAPYMTQNFDCHGREFQLT